MYLCITVTTGGRAPFYTQPSRAGRNRNNESTEIMPRLRDGVSATWSIPYARVTGRVNAVYGCTMAQRRGEGNANNPAGRTRDVATFNVAVYRILEAVTTGCLNCILNTDLCVGRVRSGYWETIIIQRVRGCLDVFSKV